MIDLKAIFRQGIDEVVAWYVRPGNRGAGSHEARYAYQRRRDRISYDAGPDAITAELYEAFPPAAGPKATLVVARTDGRLRVSFPRWKGAETPTRVRAYRRRASIVLRCLGMHGFAGVELILAPPPATKAWVNEVKPGGKERSTVQIDIETMRERGVEWGDALAEILHDERRRKGFAGRATLWSIVEEGLDFGNVRREVARVSGVGFANGFRNRLHQGLQARCDQAVRLGGEELISRDDGWRPELHIEDGRVWMPQDALSWLEVPE